MSEVLLDARLVTPGGRVRVRNATLEMLLEMQARGSSLGSWKALPGYAVTLLHFVDPGTSAVVGTATLWQQQPAAGLTGEWLQRLADDVKSWLESDDVSWVLIDLARTMATLGYKFEPRFWQTGIGGSIVKDFVWPGEFAYGDAVLINVAEFTYRVRGSGRRAVPVLGLASIKVYVRGCDDMLVTLHGIITSALRRWNRTVKTWDGSWFFNADGKGGGFEVNLFSKPCGEGERCSNVPTLGDYFGNFMPALARRIKEYVDSRAEEALSAATA